MDNYYCKIIVEGCQHPPGVYTFQDEAMYTVFRHITIVQLSHYVCKENENGVFWVKNKLTGSKLPKKLTQDELKEFMWIKLKAQTIKGA